MFSMYGLNGPLFHGTLEHLPRVPPVRRRPAVREVEPLGRSDAENPFFLPPEPASTTHSLRNAALNAYESIQHVEEERGPIYQAGQIMSGEVVTVDAEAPVERAWRSLVAHRIHQAPVLDAEGALVGIVSERDLLTALNIEHGEIRDVLSRKVHDVMTSPVISADPATDVRQIAWVMLSHGVSGVPVINRGGRLCGFISRSDILRAVVSEPPLSVWR